jgi:hypothetical protein
MAEVHGPVWIVVPGDEHPAHPIAPGGPGDAHPEHPIVLPPDTPDNGLRPEHPIYNPGGEHPSHPIVIPQPPGGVDGEHPAHPIAPGGDGGHPEHPIVLPPETELPPLEIWGPNDPRPSVPIFLPPGQPDGGGEEVGGLEFYQRKTLGINWDASFDDSAVVTVQAGSSADDLVTVRTVANDGSSSVTYPQDFTGDVLIRVNGNDGYLEGETTVE